MEMMSQLRFIKKLNKTIERKGYSLENLPLVLKDKYASFIIVLLIVKAIINLFGLNKDEENDEKTRSSRNSFDSAAKFSDSLYQVNRGFFFVKKFAASL